LSHIMIVDDEPDVARTVELTLKRLGHQPMVANDGTEALKMMHRQPPDMVILDVMMPGMDGLEVCRRLRQDPVLHQIPILFLTARSRLDDKIEGFRAGADDYMTKPYNLQELNMRVEAILRRGSWQPQQPAPGQVTAGDLTLDCRTFELTTPDRKVLLTPVEFDLMYFLMSHAGQVFASERLLQEVWGYPSDAGSPELVRMHIKKLRDRIEPTPGAPIYILTVSRHGYTLHAP
jgi:DNA-binding response OmpR family regulator